MADLTAEIEASNLVSEMETLVDLERCFHRAARNLLEEIDEISEGTILSWAELSLLDTAIAVLSVVENTGEETVATIETLVNTLLHTARRWESSGEKIMRVSLEEILSVTYRLNRHIQDIVLRRNASGFSYQKLPQISNVYMWLAVVFEDMNRGSVIAAETAASNAGAMAHYL